MVVVVVLQVVNVVNKVGVFIMEEEILYILVLD